MRRFHPRGAVIGAVGLLVVLMPSVSPLRAQPDAGARLDLDFARHLYSQGEYRLAADELERFVAQRRSHPDAEEAAFLAADCWVQLGEWVRARTRLESFIATHPVSPWTGEALLRLAATLFELGSFVQAESLYLRAAAEASHGAGEAIYWAGEAAFRRDAFPRAAELLSQATQKLPAGDLHGWALRRQAEALQRMGRDEQARDVLTRLVASPDARPDDIVSLARLLVETERPADTEVTLQTLARRWPERADSRVVRELKARSIWDQGRHDEAIAVLAERGLESVRLLGWMYMEEDRPKEASALLSGAMRTLEGSERGEAAVLLASALQRTDRPGAGDSLLAVETAGISDRTLLARAILLRASLQRDLNRLGEARQTLDRGLARLHSRGDSVEAFALYAEISAAEGRWSDASEYFLDARDRAQGDLAHDLGYRALVAAYRAESWDRVERLAGAFSGSVNDSLAARIAFWKAEAIARQGRWSEAEAAYREALPGMPTARERADAAFGRAWASLSMGKNDDALAGFREAAAADPRSETAARATLRAGDVLMAQELYREAAASYRAATQIVARREIGDEALLGLGRALSLAGETDEAIATLDRLFHASPTEDIADNALFEKAEALFRAGRFDEAEVEYRRVVALQRDRTVRDNALYRIGDCQYNRGEYATARTTYLSLVQGYPDSDLWAHAVQGALWAELQSSDAGQAIILCDTLLNRAQDESRRSGLIQAKADLLFGLNRYEDALPLYRSLGTPWADLRAAWSLARSGRVDEAQEAFESLARLWPDAREAAEGLYEAARLSRPRDSATAARLLREMLALYPGSELGDAARYELGFALEDSSDSAIAVWATLASTGGVEWRDKAVLAGAETHLAADRADSAWAWLSPLLERSTGPSPRVYWIAARVQEALGSISEARRLYLRLAYLSPQDSLAAPANEAARRLAGEGVGAGP